MHGGRHHEGNEAVVELLFKEVDDGVGLSDHIEEVEFGHRFALGQGDPLKPRLQSIVDVLVQEVADEDAQHLASVHWSVSFAGQGLGPPEGTFGQLSNSVYCRTAFQIESPTQNCN